MFLTITLNPALDKTLCVPSNPPQDTIRATEVIDLAGGKGINVARALRALGAEVRALAPLAGHPGAHLAELAAAEGIEVVSVPVPGQTRTALTVRDAQSKQYWHYLEPGPQLGEADVQNIRRAFLAALAGCHTVVISGSLPCAPAAELVPWMIAVARGRGLRTVLDSWGAALLPAVEAGPWAAKPNRFEWEITLGESLETEAGHWAALERMAAAGIQVALLSLGPEGALALAGGIRYRVHPPPYVEEINDLGGGDSMVAGLCWAAHAGCDPTETLAWAAACGAANAEVWDPGAIDRGRVEQLREQVRVERLSARASP